MAIRIQKSWAQLGNPQQPGTQTVKGIGKIINITDDHITTAAKFSGNVVVVLGHSETTGMLPTWEIVEIRAAE